MNALRWLLRRSTLRGAALGAACAVVAWVVALHPVLRGLEEWCQDACFAYRGPRPTRGGVVVVGIDDASLAELHKPLAFLSPELAEVVAYLRGRGAAAVGLDVMVPEDLDGFPGLRGEELGVAVAEAGNVVLPALRAGDRLLRPLLAWQAGPPLGIVETSEDPDHFLRLQRLAWRIGDVDYYQFAVALLKAAGRVDDSAPDGRLRVDGRVVPFDAAGRLRVNYVGPAGTVPHVSFRTVLEAARGGPPPAAGLEGALVIVGLTARSLGDYHATPYGNGTLRGLWLRQPRLMAGPEFQAQVVATLADGAFLTTPRWLSSFPAVLLAGTALGAAFARLTLAQGAALALAHHFGWRLACLAAFALGHWRVEMVAMLLTGASCYAAAFLYRWHWLRRTFGAAKGEAVARALEDDPGLMQLRGRQIELTVLFADIRGFTPFTEGCRPHEVVALLNAYFAAIVPALEDHGGVLNHYMGDGLMALFGAPQPQADHAARAVRAATAMVARVHDRAATWTALGFPGMRIGVGVHTGPAVVGTVGSPRRLDYTAIGDTVNAAARLEAANKPLGSEILISDSTYQQLPPNERARLGCVAQPEWVTVKGKAEPLAVHRVEVASAAPSVPADAVRGHAGVGPTAP